jgi:hypothetical protein
MHIKSLYPSPPKKTSSNCTPRVEMRANKTLRESLTVKENSLKVFDPHTLWMTWVS